MKNLEAWNEVLFGEPTEHDIFELNDDPGIGLGELDDWDDEDDDEGVAWDDDYDSIFDDDDELSDAYDDDEVWDDDPDPFD